ncbi:MAG: hypothetical protein II028_07945 [Clostridia bacterium]|jgi:hypothetical protein|nr:hypothetical protein [Clostridia bacterium]
MKSWLQKVFAGRYGVDQLSRFLTTTAMITLLLSVFLKGTLRFFFWLLTIVILVWGYIRMFSRNTYKRRAENNAYLTLRYRLTGKITAFRQRMKQKKYYRFYKCPGCGVTTRVPKGKGKIRITCPKCGESFVRKS